VAIELYTDGACKGNPGPGGWGVLIRIDGVDARHCGGERETTNNRMELQAAIEGLRLLETTSEVVLVTDSQYVRKGITEWIGNWKRNGWRTAAKKPVKNADLWRGLDEQSQRHSIKWNWVKGHSGHAENEIADQLANEGLEKI
jgi:ribonuclease HI